jgi:hypothetical protein
MTHALPQALMASLTPSQARTPYEAPTTTGRLTGALTGLTGPLLAASDPAHAHATRRIFDADSRPIHTHLALTGSHGLSDALGASHVPTVPRAHRTAHRALYGPRIPLAEPSEPYACTLRA